MAITIQDTTPTPAKLPNIRLKTYRVALDNSYPTGGEAWDLSADFDVIYAAIFEQGGGRTFELTSKGAPASAKIKCYQQKDPAAAGGADIALPEFTNTGDLSAYTDIGVVVIGRKS